MPGTDPNHWLFRFTSEEWLRAADNELRRAEEALGSKQHRPGVAGARRAAGMAWNAVLVTTPDDRYGRSYMEHVVALADAPDDDPAIPTELRAAARLLRETPAAQPALITIGKPDMSTAEAAERIVEYARGLVGV